MLRYKDWDSCVADAVDDLKLDGMVLCPGEIDLISRVLVGRISEEIFMDSVLTELSGDSHLGPALLRNNFDLTDTNMLECAERVLSARRIAELRHDGSFGGFDASHVRELHKYIFRDIYPWAGEFRRIAITRDSCDFTPPGEIISELDGLVIFSGKAAHRSDVVAMLVQVFCDFCRIRPFKDGNNRVMRIFIEQLALLFGWDLSFSGMNQVEFARLTQAGCRRDLVEISKCFSARMLQLYKVV